MPPPPTRDRLFNRVLPVWVDRAFLIKAITFAGIGVVNTIVDFTIFSIGYFYFGLPIIVANIISWSVAVTNSYVLNSMITFARESGRRLRLKSYLMFVPVQFGGLIANTATVVLGSRLIPHFFGSIFGLDPVLIAKVIAIGVSFMVDFTLSYLVVFRRREQAPEKQVLGEH